MRFPTRPSFPSIARAGRFSQNRGDLEASFKALGLAERLRLLEPGVATPIDLG
jgi:hypothetical protein